MPGRQYPGSHRQYHLTFRVNGGERKLIREYAATMNMSKSDAIRTMCLYTPQLGPKIEQTITVGGEVRAAIQHTRKPGAGNTSKAQQEEEDERDIQRMEQEEADYNNEQARRTNMKDE